MNGNACNAGYNPKIDKIFRSPSPPKSRTENLHILALEGLILYFRGKGELLAVPVYSVRDCDLGQNRWKTFDNPPTPSPHTTTSFPLQIKDEMFWPFLDFGVMGAQSLHTGNILIPANTECNRYSRLTIPEVYIVCRVVYICSF